MAEGLFKGRSAVVTGGARGIGLACAAKVVADGGRVALWDRDLDRARQSAKELKEAIAVEVDVTNDASIDKALAVTERQLAAPDILIASAGITGPNTTVVQYPVDAWRQVIDINLTGVFLCNRALAPGMVERGWGRIVNIGSTAASVGWKDNPAYCASKAGLLGLTRCVALEGAAHGVTCVMISPTWVETELMRRNVAQVVEREGKGRSAEELMQEFRNGNPQGRMMQPEEIAALAVFLCSDLAKGITMENIQVTGGALW